jgi:hypothetical protein
MRFGYEEQLIAFDPGIQLHMGAFATPMRRRPFFELSGQLKLRTPAVLTLWRLLRVWRGLSQPSCPNFANFRALWLVLGFGYRVKPLIYNKEKSISI